MEIDRNPIFCQIRNSQVDWWRHSIVPKKKSMRTHQKNACQFKHARCIDSKAERAKDKYYDKIMQKKMTHC